LHGHSGPREQSAMLSSRGCEVEQGFLPNHLRAMRACAQPLSATCPTMGQRRCGRLGAQLHCDIAAPAVRFFPRHGGS
jgi:hypothetical protein